MRSLPLLTTLGLLAVPAAAAAENAPHVPDGALEQFRTPLEVLTERAIGTTSRPIRFDWRKTRVGFGGFGTQLSELNDFWSAGGGLFVRRPFGGKVMGELDFARIQTWSTDSSALLAQTPFRQYGRPSRFEVDLNVGLPLAEGVVTAWPRWFPATELVLSATAGLRYLLYTDAFGGATFKDVAGALFAPKLSQIEQNNLLSIRPPGMQVDLARYGLMAGFTTDLYFQNGLFVFPRAMIALPLFQPVTQTQLGFWWELSLGVGWAF